MVCVQYGIVSTKYFLDEMKPYELALITESLHLRVKDSWEQSRMVAYIMAQVNSKKRMKPTDIIKFGWEKESEHNEKKSSVTYTEEDVERLKAIAEERQKELKEMGII